MFTVIASIIAAAIALVAQIMVMRLHRKVKKSEDIAKIKERYSNPLLKASEELYNKINDIVKNRKKDYPLHAFENLTSKLNDIQNISDIFESANNIYLSQIIYLFARFFGAIELIKKQLGFIKLASDEETQVFHKSLKRAAAVFYSGRFHSGFKIIKDKNMKYHGRIIDGAQVLIGETMILKSQDSFELITFTDFCKKLVIEQEFKKILLPIIIFLDNLKDIEINYDDKKEVDFRWTKLIIFASNLRSLIKQIDTSSVVELLPETEKYEKEILKKSTQVSKNIIEFEKAY